MILDDHEIEDNWPSKRDHDDDELYRNAIQAYETFQSSNSPALGLLANGRINRDIKSTGTPSLTVTPTGL